VGDELPPSVGGKKFGFAMFCCETDLELTSCTSACALLAPIAVSPIDIKMDVVRICLFFIVSSQKFLAEDTNLPKVIVDKFIHDKYTFVVNFKNLASSITCPDQLIVTPYEPGVGATAHQIPGQRMRSKYFSTAS
jgi:hypothetical protein